MVSNLRPAPFSITPGAVGQVLGDAARSPLPSGITEVPFADVQLVDRPRRSEDPQLAQANDNATARSWLMEALPHG